MTDYAELHAYSCFSFRRGAATPEDLIESAQQQGIEALAITDRDGLYGSVRQWLHTKKLLEGASHPVPRAIYGAELGMADGSRLVALVRDRDGWRNLAALLSESRMSCEKGTSVLPRESLIRRGAGLTILSGGRFGPVDRALLGMDARREPNRWNPKGAWRRPLGDWMDDSGLSVRSAVERGRDDRRQLAAWRDDPASRLRHATEAAAELRDAFGDRFFLEVTDHRLPEDQWLRGVLRGISDDLGIPRVATNLVHYARPHQRRLQDVVSCVRLKTTLRDAGTRLLPNGSFGLQSPATMARLFADDPGAIARTIDVARDCDFDLADLPYAFPIYPVPEGHTLQTFMEERTWEGAAIRYGDRLETDPRISAQIRHELDVIGRMGLAGYFLIVWDISNECRRRGILCQGRGSAANSCVCYCLRITAVDPIGLSLLFERFLSEARGGFPDIDIDISNTRREEVLQFVYDKYGRDHCAMVCNVITYHPRSAIRDVGKAFGLGLDQVDRMAKSLSSLSDSGDLSIIFGEGGEGGEEAITDDAHTLKQVLHYTEQLCGFPRHIGIHSGGVVISGVPIGEACPTENATMEDRTVLQWDKDDVAQTGLVKIDLLALGMLSVIQEAARLLAMRGIHFDMADLTADDPAVYDMICEADTVGMFQIESRAQMNTLPRLRPRSFHDLVVEVALIRPGPIQGDMVHPYLRRRDGVEPIEYAHPSLEPILKRTLGIPLFQEQAMKMAIATAGFSPGEADRLRKVMGFKRGTEELERLFTKMVEGMKANGIDEETAMRIRNQLRGFAAYGFPESHAASFALIVYASGHLKKYQHAAFTGGLLNCQPMGFYSAATLVNDARRCGVVVHPLCVNRSDWRWRLEGEYGLRGGLLQVKGLGEDDGLAIEEARRSGGPFRSIRDFCDRVELDRSKLGKLAEAGGFDGFEVDRRQALWEVTGWRRRLPLEGPPKQVVLPGFAALSSMEVNLLDHSTSGFSPDQHPLLYVRKSLARRGIITSQGLKKHADGSWVTTGGLVITRQRPMTAKGVFFITLEDEEGFSNIIVHETTFLKHRRMLSRVKFLQVSGKMQLQMGVVSVLGYEFVDLSRENLLMKAAPANIEKWATMPSRDFH
ncbi:MAG: DNA polymerase III subunit alpha [Proteobacteria bacterium]|nr:DNA polymerase III subunit alpha [Pseudomonadota bacterium]